MMKVAEGLDRRLLLQWALLLSCALALAYLMAKSVLSTTAAIDFHYIWLAGSLWLQELNPYAGNFADAGRLAFPDSNVSTHWVYPPYWWPISVIAASIPAIHADWAWRTLSAMAIVSGCAILARNVPGAEWRGSSGKILLIYCCTMASTAVSLSLGQTSPLMFLGACLYAHALLADRRAVMTLALIILALKPTVGIVAWAALLSRRFWWPCMAGSGAALLAMALPPVLMHGAVPVLKGFLAEVARYTDAPANFPGAMTGLRSVAFNLSAVDLSPGLLAFIGAGIAFIVSWIIGRMRGAGPPEVLAVVLVSITLFVPLHTYDLLLLAPFIVITRSWTLPVRVLVAAVLLVVYRVNNLANATGLTSPEESYFPGTFVASLAILVLACALAWQLLLTSLRKTPAG